MMELNEFIAQTLQQIVDGVKKAQIAVVDTGAMVNPDIKDPRPTSNFIGISRARLEPVFLVHFEVALSATEGKGSKGGIGVMAGALAIGSQGRSDSESAYASRITFDVPLVFPEQKIGGQVKE
jgi:hypothetical protein